MQHRYPVRERAQVHTQDSAPSSAYARLLPLVLLAALLVATACGTASDDGLVGHGDGDAASQVPQAADVADVQRGDDAGALGRLAHIRVMQSQAGPDYVVWDEDGELVARNPGQRLDVAFGASAVRIALADKETSVSMAWTGYGRGDALSDVGVASLERDGHAVTYRRDSGSSWYLNGPLGVEQGFTLGAPPDAGDWAGSFAGDGLLVLEVSFEGLVPTLSADGSEVLLRDAGGAVSLHYSDLFALDADGRLLPSAMVVHGQTVRLEVDDREARYPLTVDPLVWSQQSKLTASDAATADRFGVSVSISGDTAIVGANLDDDNGSLSGSAYVFERSGSMWTQQQKLTASDAAANDVFGGSVSISGDTVIVGAFGNADNGSFSGSAYVFERSGSTWTEQQKLTPSDGAASDNFGYAVSISGDTVIVGANGDDDNGQASGSAYVFERSGSTWTEQQKLTASDAAASDSFGQAVSISGNTVAVGAYLNDDGGPQSGSAYVFERIGTTWTEQQNLTAGDAQAGDRLGWAVSISGDTVVAGAYHDDDAGSESGSAYVFVRIGTTWTEQSKLTAANAAAGDRFGWAVSISGDTAIVGAHRDDDAGVSSGSALVFARIGVTWTEQSKLTAVDAAAGDQFGIAVSVSGDTAVAGAVLDDDGGTDSGSAYVFHGLLTDATPCTEDIACVSGNCVDGVCCDTICGGGDASDCQACTAALTDGVDGTCAPLSNGMECRAATDVCDVAEACDGTNADCPVDALEAAGTECRAASEACDAAEVCDGASAACPTDADAADGSSCDDGDSCTDADACQSGACLPGDDICGQGGAGGTGGSNASVGGGGSADAGDGSCSCRLPGDAPQKRDDGWLVFALGAAVVLRRRHAV